MFGQISSADIDAFRKIFCTCPFGDCEEVMPIIDVDIHIRFCTHATILCPDCSIPVTNADLPFHLHGSCKKRPVECPRCLEEMPVDEYLSHDEDQHPLCDGCKVRYHIPTEGKQHQLVQCRVCSQRLLACQLEGHMADAGHASDLPVELKVERKQLQETEKEIDDHLQIQDDQALKHIQEQHYIIQHSTFSQEHKGDSIELLDSRTAAMSSNHQKSVSLNHPGFNKGIWEWEMKLVAQKGYATFGAASPGPIVGLYPGDLSMPSSIGMGSCGNIGINREGVAMDGSGWKDDCFPYDTGDVILLSLDFKARTIKWTLKKDPRQSATRSLPTDGCYVPVIGLAGAGTTVRVESFRCVEE